MQQIQMLSGVFLTDDSPVTARGVAVHEHGAVSLTLVVTDINREDPPMGIVRVSVQGSDDAENWTEIEAVDFQGAPVETQTLHTTIVTGFVRARVSLIKGAIGAIVALALLISSGEGSGT